MLLLCCKYNTGDYAEERQNIVNIVITRNRLLGADLMRKCVAVFVIQHFLRKNEMIWPVYYNPVREDKKFFRSFNPNI